MVFVRGIEIVEVRELVAQRVADGAIGLADYVDAFFKIINWEYLNSMYETATKKA